MRPAVAGGATASYDIRHDLEFRYSRPVRGSVTTLHVTPGGRLGQVLRSLTIDTDPGGTVISFRGPFGNAGHFFDRHSSHRRLTVRVRSRVDADRPPSLPDRLAPGAWKAIASAASPEVVLMTLPSRFVRPTAALERFIARHGLEPAGDPLASIRAVRSTLYRVFDYAPGSTRADSSIDDVLEGGRGVCQDYAHVMASILRGWGIPARHAAGYLGPGPDDGANGESHAWVECWLPGFGWRGFDPANDCDCDERHVRVSVGRDYADAPPVRGTFQGDAASSLDAVVAVTRRDADPSSTPPGV